MRQHTAEAARGLDVVGVYNWSGRCCSVWPILIYDPKAMRLHSAPGHPNDTGGTLSLSGALMPKQLADCLWFCFCSVADSLDYCEGSVTETETETETKTETET